MRTLPMPGALIGGAVAGIYGLVCPERYQAKARIAEFRDWMLGFRAVPLLPA